MSDAAIMPAIFLVMFIVVCFISVSRKSSGKGIQIPPFHYIKNLYPYEYRL